MAAKTTTNKYRFRLSPRHPHQRLVPVAGLPPLASPPSSSSSSETVLHLPKQLHHLLRRRPSSSSSSTFPVSPVPVLLPVLPIAPGGKKRNINYCILTFPLHKLYNFFSKNSLSLSYFFLLSLWAWDMLNMRRSPALRQLFLIFVFVGN